MLVISTTVPCTSSLDVGSACVFSLIPVLRWLSLAVDWPDPRVWIRAATARAGSGTSDMGNWEAVFLQRQRPAPN